MVVFEKRLFRRIAFALVVFGNVSTSAEVVAQQKTLNNRGAGDLSDPAVWPVSAVGKVTVQWHMTMLSSCSGAVVGPKLVLTSAHCLYFNVDVAKPGMIHFVGGFVKGTPAVHVLADRVEIANAFRLDEIQNEKGAGSDWALIVLKDRLSIPPVPVHSLPVNLSEQEIDLQHGVGIGYGMQHLYSPVVANNCKIRTSNDSTILFYDCLAQYGRTGKPSFAINYGYSGAPILLKLDGKLTIVGIGSRAGGANRQDNAEGVACSATQFENRILELNRELN
jgi:V8-like Glu-specific endopeptidase